MINSGQTNIKLSEDVKVDLEPVEPAGSALRKVLKALADEMISSEAGVLEDEDPRNLHRYRIAVRRSRTILSELKRVFLRDEYV
ncbi:MAG: CHAD domain-containing protein, partial [Candidatus Latescibacterota bacterium]